MGSRENPVQAACLRFFQLCGWRVWRNNSRVVTMPGRGGKPRPVRFGETGSPDIFAFRIGPIIGGVPSMVGVAVECKSERGKQSEMQRAWQGEWERHGGIYLLVRSTWDLEDGLRKKGITP